MEKRECVPQKRILLLRDDNTVVQWYCCYATEWQCCCIAVRHLYSDGAAVLCDSVLQSYWVAEWRSASITLLQRGTILQCNNATVLPHYKLTFFSSHWPESETKELCHHIVDIDILCAFSTSKKSAQLSVWKKQAVIRRVSDLSMGSFEWRTLFV